MNQPSLQFDICSRKHKGNPESVEAFKRAQSSTEKQREEILTLLAVHELTGKELARAMGRPFYTIAPRCAELKAMGHIEPTGIRREGSAELRAK